MAGCAVGGWLIALLAATPIPAPAPAPAPSIELLLHLAEFGDAEDRYLDPTELDASAVVEEPESEAEPGRETRAGEVEDDPP